MTLVGGPIGGMHGEAARFGKRLDRAKQACRAFPRSPGGGDGSQPLQGRDGVPLVTDPLAQDQALAEHGLCSLVLAKFHQRPSQVTQHAGGAVDATQRPVERQAFLRARHRPHIVTLEERDASQVVQQRRNGVVVADGAHVGQPLLGQCRRPLQVAVVESDCAEGAKREPQVGLVPGLPRQRHALGQVALGAVVVARAVGQHPGAPERFGPERWRGVAAARQRRLQPPLAFAHVAVVVPEPDQGAGHSKPGCRLVRDRPRQRRPQVGVLGFQSPEPR